MKLKKWWGISALMLAGIGVVAPITLTTSCAEKKDWTFNNYNEVDNYLQKHKQDVSEAYIFSNTPNQTDYEFLKKNVNFQFFINGILFQGSILLFYTSMEAPAKKIELHIKNKTTAEMDLHGTDFKTKVTITYDDFLLKQVVSTETESEREYDFKTAVFERHYYGLGLAPYAFERYLDFYYAVGDNTESLYLLLSPYDWANHFLFGTIN